MVPEVVLEAAGTAVLDTVVPEVLEAMGIVTPSAVGIVILETVVAL